MGYFLLDHRNPHGPHFYPTRRGKVKAIVVHCTAGLEDMRGADDSAEATARYAASTDRQVSWHSGSDADSSLELLPARYTAWHCINYNSTTYGHEISKRDMTWADEPADWVGRTLFRAAAHLGPMATRLGVPHRKATKAEVDRAIATGGPPVGFIGHRELDPSRRTDPGADFPWRRFLTLMQTEDDMPTADEIADAVWKRQIDRHGTDGPVAAATLLSYTHYQAKRAADPDGLAAELAPLLKAEMPVVDQGDLEAALRKVFGSLNDQA